MDDAVRDSPPVADGLRRFGADGAGQVVVEQQGRMAFAFEPPAPGPWVASVSQTGDDHGATHLAIGAIAPPLVS
jgi:hypothetical protein